MHWHLRRAFSGIRSALTGWLAAFVLTLPFQLVELLRNAAPSCALLSVADGLALWAAFTGVVGVTAALGIAAPAALVLPRNYVRRYRWVIVSAITGSAVYEVGKRLGTWEGLAEGSSHNPFNSSLFWMYSVFAAVFAFVTVFVYGRRSQAND